MTGAGCAEFVGCKSIELNFPQLPHIKLLCSNIKFYLFQITMMVLVVPDFGFLGDGGLCNGSGWKLSDEVAGSSPLVFVLIFCCFCSGVAPAGPTRHWSRCRSIHTVLLWGRQ